MGPLPAAGGWVRLEVPASAVGLEGKYVHAIAFTLYGGRANWDLAGVEGVNVWTEEICDFVCPPEPMECYWHCDYIPHQDYENYVMMDDSSPAGATPGADGGYGWNWTGARTPEPVHQHYFYGATQRLQVNAGDNLYAYVYLDPANPPSEVMLQWSGVGSGWSHRAYWGANNIPWGTDGTVDRKYMGPLPAAGGWVRLEVPASAVGLEGRTVDGMAFSLYGGRAAWDKAGRRGAPPVGPPNPVTGRDGFDNLAYSAVNNRIISPGLMNMKTGLKKSKKTVRKTTRKKSSEPIVEMGSGNIWTDLGFPDAEERQAKALLSDAIEEAIKHRRLTQTQAAVILRVDQSKVSKIVRGRVSHYSLDRLIRFLNALDRDVDIVIRPKAKSRKKAALKVIAASRVA